MYRVWAFYLAIVLFAAPLCLARNSSYLIKTKLLPEKLRLSRIPDFNCRAVVG
jgi:hypothetical protein